MGKESQLTQLFPPHEWVLLHRHPVPDASSQVVLRLHPSPEREPCLILLLPLMEHCELFPSTTETEPTVWTASHPCFPYKPPEAGLPLTALPWGAFPTWVQLTSVTLALSFPYSFKSFAPALPTALGPSLTSPGLSKPPGVRALSFSGLPNIQTSFPSHFLLKHLQDRQRLRNLITRHHLAPGGLGMLTDSARSICFSHTCPFMTGLSESVSSGGSTASLSPLSTIPLKHVTFNSGESNFIPSTLIYTWGQFLGQVMQHPSLEPCSNSKDAYPPPGQCSGSSLGL